MPDKVLFVCLGNICRSPTAEGVFRTLVERAGLSAEITIDSAGTGSWHVGEPPDARMRRAARRHGYELGGVARRVEPSDFEEFDHVLAMDADNLANLRRACPPPHADKVRLFGDYDSDAPGADVPDPYYGGESGFDVVVKMVERCSERLLEQLRPSSAR